MTGSAINDLTNFSPENDDQGKSRLEIDMPDVIPGDLDYEPIEDDGDEPITYLENGFNRDKQVWKNPRVQIAAVAAVALIVVAGVALVFNSQLSFPGLGNFSLADSEDEPDLDDTELPQSSDGAWQRQSLRSNMGKGFEGESDEENKLLQNKPVQKAQVVKPAVARTKPPAARPTAPRAAPVVRPAVRSRVASRPIPRYVPKATPRAAPRVQKASPPKVKPVVSPVVKQEPERTPQERMQAALMATSSIGAGAPNSSNQAPQATQVSSDGGGEYLASEQAVLDGTPQQLFDRSTVAQGDLLMGIAFSPEDTKFLKGQALEIAITNPGETGLPEGSVLVAELVLPEGGGSAKNAPVRLKPTAIAIGNAEYPLPEGHLMVTRKNGKPLVAKRAKPGLLKTLGTVAKDVAGIVSPLGLIGGDTRILNTVGNQADRIGGGSEPSQVLYLKQGDVEVRVVKPLSLPEFSEAEVPEEFVSELMELDPQPTEDVYSEVDLLRFSDGKTDQILYQALDGQISDEELYAIN